MIVDSSNKIKVSAQIPVRLTAFAGAAYIIRNNQRIFSINKYIIYATFLWPR